MHPSTCQYTNAVKTQDKTGNTYGHKPADFVSLGCIVSAQAHVGQLHETCDRQKPGKFSRVDVAHKAIQEVHTVHSIGLGALQRVVIVNVLSLCKWLDVPLIQLGLERDIRLASWLRALTEALQKKKAKTDNED